MGTVLLLLLNERSLDTYNIIHHLIPPMRHYQHTEWQVIVNITVNCTIVLNIEFLFHAINLP